MSTAVSVILCVYTEQRWDDMVAAIASVQRQTHPPTEIIVVVDYNPPLRARLADIGGITIIPNTQQRGLSGARNSGCMVARGDIIAFLDDDATAEPQWLQAMVAAYADGRVIGAGGEIIPNWAQGKPRWFPTEFLWVVGCSYRGLPTAVAPIRNPIGGNMSFRRTVFTHIGGFRSEIGRVGTVPLGCEETEWCIRAQLGFPGGVFLYVPEARTHHHVPQMRATWRYFRRRCYAEGLSKAAIGRFVPTTASLAAETGYVTRTLPSGIIRVTTDVVCRRDPRLFGQVAAMLLGLMGTAWGYAMGKLRGGKLGGPRATQAHETRMRMRDAVS